MNLFFALCVSLHHRWGYLLSPCMLQTVPNKDFLLVNDLVCSDNLKKIQKLVK